MEKRTEMKTQFPEEFEDIPPPSSELCRGIQRFLHRSPGLLHGFKSPSRPLGWSPDEALCCRPPDGGLRGSSAHWGQHPDTLLLGFSWFLCWPPRFLIHWVPGGSFRPLTSQLPCGQPPDRVSRGSSTPLCGRPLERVRPPDQLCRRTSSRHCRPPDHLFHRQPPDNLLLLSQPPGPRYRCRHQPPRLLSRRGSPRLLLRQPPGPRHCRRRRLPTPLAS
ncbi:hypothetical protein CRENBAI_011799 [Crenichthys baileyi]|uniref:Uncharacterized protein n=1 Tax=Crenichthys baileyi TaxID=28760 RepID=A0AAV9SLI2_9TELE